MSKYTITHTCGHSETVQICGPSCNRESEVAYLESRLCAICFAAKCATDRQAANAAAAVANAAAGLPALLGSPKQIAWAESIRAAAIADLDKRLAAARAQIDRLPYMFRAVAQEAIVAIDGIRGKASAAWWIDHRNDVLAEVRYIASTDNLLAYIYAA